MNSTPFRVLPWEHGGVAPAPAQITPARVEGRARLFEAKVRENVAYFRFADEPDDGRVWALWNEVSEQDLSGQFAREVEAGHIGRYFVVERSFSTQTVSERFQDQLKRRFQSSNMNLLGPTSLAVIVNDENRGRVQEWCGGSWFDFALPPRVASGGARKPSIWHRGWNAKGVRGALARLAGELAFRPWTINDSDSAPLRFVCGSEQQLNALFRAIYTIYVPKLYSENHGFKTSSVYRMNETVVASTEFNPARASDLLPVAPPDLLAVVVAHNLPVGGQWHAVNRTWHDWDEVGDLIECGVAPEAAELRVDFEFLPGIIVVRAEIPKHPTAHEQLEARLFLRDWMHQNLPSKEFAKLKKYIEA